MSRRPRIRTTEPEQVIMDNGVAFKGRVLHDGETCPDYGIEEKSTRCQNCRFNRFSVESAEQYCLPHSKADARAKGCPEEAPENHFRKWMDKVDKHNAEKELAFLVAKEKREREERDAQEEGGEE